MAVNSEKVSVVEVAALFASLVRADVLGCFELFLIAFMNP